MSELTGTGPKYSRQRSFSDHYRSKASTGLLSGAKGLWDATHERTAARESRRKGESEQKEALERSRATEEARILEQSQKGAETRTQSSMTSGHLYENHEGMPRSPSRTSGHRPSNTLRPEKHQQTCGDASGIQYVQRSHGSYKERQSIIDDNERRGTRPIPRQTDRVYKSAHPDSSYTSSILGTRHTAAASTSATRSSFPHAFERWETLSAHWEGLTSYWIRRLEENSHEMERDPLMQQLSRQVTDLSAAGANLFHAVVELQRLRASSERKFQRWFYETRTEQEQSHEILATVERKLEAERKAHAECAARLAAQQAERLNSEQKVAEMQRELQINKEEAKRAWGELGRREHKERSRVSSLRDGLPTVIGGVEVVPMLTGASSRRESSHRTSHSLDSRDNSRNNEISIKNDESRERYSEMIGSEPDLHLETSDSRQTPVPNTFESARQSPTSPPHPPPLPRETHIGEEADERNFYQQVEGTSLHPVAHRPSEIASESLISYDDEEEQGYEHEHQDHIANKIPARIPGYLDPTNDFHEREQYANDNSSLQFIQIPDTEYIPRAPAMASYSNVSGSYSLPCIDMSNTVDYTDYDSQEYGPGPEWSNIPRQHHPTRLSDVMEEDERSRTSASQISRSRE